MGKLLRSLKLFFWIVAEPKLCGEYTKCANAKVANALLK